MGHNVAYMVQVSWKGWEEDRSDIDPVIHHAWDLLEGQKKSQ